MSRTPTHLHRTNYTSTAPTPGFRGASGTGTLRPDHGPSPRLDRGGDPRRQTQGCDNRIAQHNVPVSQNRPITQVSQPSFALNGAFQAPETSFRSSGRAARRPESAQPDPVRRQAGEHRGQAVQGGPAGRLRGQAVDRTKCTGWPDAKGNPRHGNRQARKRFGCNCPDAIEAERLYSKRHRQGRNAPKVISSLGTARRLQALAVAGHSLRAVAIHLGVPHGNVYSIRAPRYDTILAGQAQQIAELYDRLITVPPQGTSVKRTQTYAQKHKWAPAAAWDNIDDPDEKPKHKLKDDPNMIDELELERLLAGLLPPEPTRKRARLNDAAVQILDQKGLSAPQIAARLKISERCVVRVRARIGISHVAPPTQAELNPGIVRADRRTTNQAEAPHSTAHERHHEAA